VRKDETGFTLIELLIVMFWMTCCMLLDGVIQNYLNHPAAGAVVPFLLLLVGFVVCFATGWFVSEKLLGKRATVVVFCIPFCLAVLSTSLLRDWKGTAYVVHFASGFYSPVLSVWTLAMLSIVIDTFPVCSAGKCRGRQDFTVSESCYYSNKDRPADGSIEYRCKCGDEYVRRGEQFMTLDSGRTPHPYKKLVGFHKWADDTEE